ncbi:hypothetical protein AU467_33435 [Mesorhizobium loti]|uniref:Uncharacterized protein n=1 Tax=Rhizobium loti TaxID=381 RepID=A0A101KMK7_RHILI|nr:hypothetical protein AU467_33435 [Mesorhizobium loti]
MEPHNGWFDTDAWMRDYAALQEQQRARQQSGGMPADQARFEQQLSELQLSCAGARPSDAAWPEASMPDTPPAKPHGNLQRADIEDSMWMPQQSKPRNGGFSSTRCSVELPPARFGGSNGRASQSDLDEMLVSSTNYTAPSGAPPAVRTKDGKGRHLWSRVKSGVVKAFSGSCRENSSVMSASDVVHSELRIYYAKRRLPTEPFESDKILVSRFLRACLGSTFVQTAQRNASHLHQFSAWLNQRERDPIADRLNDHELDNDARVYAQQVDATGSKKTKDQIIEALENIRQTDLPPAELRDDERLIADFREAAESGGRARRTVSGWVTSLRKFGIWLRSTNLTLSGLLDHPEELNRLATLSGTKDLHAALTVLQEFHAANLEERPANFNPHRRQRLAAPPAEDDALMKRFKTAAMQAGVPKNTIDSSLIHAKNSPTGSMRTTGSRWLLGFEMNRWRTI